MDKKTIRDIEVTGKTVLVRVDFNVPRSKETGEITNFQRGTKCTLIIDYDGKYVGEIENKYYNMLELETRDSVMKKESEITDSKIEREHHKYIPPETHPWRKNMMLKS